LQVIDCGPIKATVSHVEYLGADAMLECRIGDHALLCRAPGQTALRPGSEVSLTVHPDDLHVFHSGSGRRLDTLPPEFAALFPRGADDKDTSGD
jgi:sn-glycerol 3-phosphate transport system ATP-binding protein